MITRRCLANSLYDDAAGITPPACQAVAGAPARSSMNLPMPDCTPCLAQLLEIDRVDARVLVLVLDLTAAVLDADVHAHEHPALVGGEGIAQAAEGDGEIARRLGRGVEMLVEHLVGRREHPAVLPVDAHEILVALVPQQRVARARSRQRRGSPAPCRCAFL